MQALSVGRVRDHRPGSASEQQAAQRIAVVGPVGGEGDGGRQGLDQVGRDRRVTPLARRDDEGYEAAQPVDQGMELGGRPAPRAAYSVG